MTDINLIREFNAYKKMYLHMFNAVTDAINICQDPFVKSNLIQAQQQAEAFYLGENKSCHMSVDEETIVDLLVFMKNEEVKKPLSQQNRDFIDECEDWICDLSENRTIKNFTNLLHK